MFSDSDDYRDPGRRGLAGIDFARGLMRRHGNLLSKTSRGNLTEMIEEIRSVPLTPFVPPEPSPWTIYQICSGEVDWEKEIEDDEDEDEEEDLGRLNPCAGSSRLAATIPAGAGAEEIQEMPPPRRRAGTTPIHTGRHST